MRLNLKTLLVVVPALLSGCAAHSYCLSKQNYDSAKSIQPIQGVDGLSLPESPVALRVPASTVNDAPYGVLAPDPNHKGKSAPQCLDDPPTYVAPVAPDDGKSSPHA